MATLAENSKTLPEEMKILFSGNNPRVFIAYTNTDREFIEKVEDDLFQCQIIPWLYSEELRADQPLKEIIFEYGISKCDAILIYLTPDMLDSSMVKKELRPDMLKMLEEHHISLLTYVQEEKLRNKVPQHMKVFPLKVWSNTNYQDVIANFVARVWHSFQKRAIISAVNGEKLRRMELELELERLSKPKEEAIFSDKEKADFEYIWSRLDRYEIVDLSILARQGSLEKAIGLFQFRVHMQNLVTNLDRIMGFQFDNEQLYIFLNHFFSNKMPPKLEHQKEQKTVCSSAPNLLSELLMYSFLERSDRLETIPLPTNNTARNLKHRTVICHVFSEKMFRFKYWLVHQEKLSDEILWTEVEPEPDNEDLFKDFQ
jgi:hypothetical protein